MYNPYNWKITPKSDDDSVEMKMGIYPGDMSSSCILDELGHVCVKLGIIEAELGHLRKKVEDLEAECYILKQKKMHLLSVINDS